MERSPQFKVPISSLLPLLREQAHSVATVCHCMDKIRAVVSHLNPGQVPVIAADQPLFAMESKCNDIGQKNMAKTSL